MMRVTHTRGGFKRLMQMTTKAAIFVFVEGQDSDPYFYGEICAPVFAEAGINYEIVGAWRLGNSGGKEILIGFYDYLAVTNSLMATFQGRTFAAIFFLDKDIDDILHLKRYSDHIVYTEHYAVENYLFAEADLAQAAASASSLERRELAESLGDAGAWRRAMAEAWTDWVTFCIFAHKHGVACAYNFRRAASIINDPIDAPADPAVVSQHRIALQALSAMTPQEFNKAFRAVERLVNRHYRRNLHDRVFTGRWYVSLLEAHVAHVAAGRPYNSHALRNRIMSALGPTLNFSAPWVEHFRAPLRTLLARF